MNKMHVPILGHFRAHILLRFKLFSAKIVPKYGFIFVLKHSNN